eukprot:gene5293-10586_t
MIISSMKKSKKVVAKPYAWQDFDMKNVTYSTLYLTMTDGVEIAVDIWLPSKEPASYPVAINAARYYRSCRIQWPFSMLKIFRNLPFSLMDHDILKGFLAEDIAVVIFDVRGGGASMGYNKYPWWTREREDYEEVIAWIMKQSFCNKRLGIWGISYGANAAYHISTLSAMRKATGTMVAEEGVLACGALYGFWDVYRDLGYPGGIELQCFLKNWSIFCGKLDKHRIWITSLPACILFEGVTPVATPTDSGRAKRKQAAIAHRNNWNPLKDGVICRDDKAKETKETSAFISPGGTLLYHRRNKTNLDQYIPNVLHLAGWFDSSAGSTIVAYASMPAKVRYLVIGPWTHGGTQHVRTFGGLKNTPNPFSSATILRWFFVQSLKGVSIPLLSNTSASNTSTTINVASEMCGVQSMSDIAAADTDPLVADNDKKEKKKKNPTININTTSTSIQPPLSSSPSPSQLHVPLGEMESIIATDDQSLESEIESSSSPIFRIAMTSPSSTPSRINSVKASQNSNNMSNQFTDTDTGTESKASNVNGNENARTTTMTEIWLPGNVGAKEITQLLCPQRPVCYYVMQAEIWRFKESFPLNTSRICFALTAGETSSLHPPSSSKDLQLVPCPVGPNPDKLAYLDWMEQTHGNTNGNGNNNGNGMINDCSTVGRTTVTHRIHPQNDKGYLGPSRWTSMTDLVTPVAVDLNHSSLNQMRFTSSPLIDDIEVTGYVTLVLWALTIHPHSSQGDAGDIFSTLQCIDTNGEAIYVTEGCLRLKHRHFFTESDIENGKDTDNICPSPLHNNSSNLGDEGDKYEELYVDIPDVPRRSFRNDYLKLGPLGSTSTDSKPEIVWLTMQPTSFLFKKGQKIRISVYGADVNHFRSCADTDYDLKTWIGNSQSSQRELSFGSRLLLPVVPTIQIP